MKIKVIRIIIIAFCFFVSCQKTAVIPVSENDIISLVFNKGAVSNLNKVKKEITVDIADFTDKRALIAIFQLSPGAVATINGIKQFSSETKNDFTNPVIYTITSATGEMAYWTVKMQSNNHRIGLGNVITQEKRLETQHEWYLSQDTTGINSKINGAGACIAMALKWMNPQKYPNPDIADIRRIAVSILFPKDPNSIFTPEAVSYYFTQKDIFFKIINLTPDPVDITEHIDRGNLVILLTDFSHIPYNELKQQYTNRFYPLLDKTISTTGHWIIVKGYKRVDDVLYYETYDPCSRGEKYDNGEPKGRNRYYNSTYISSGIKGQNGWPYAYIIDKKQNASTEILRNEVYLPYYQVPLPDLNLGYIPKLGTWVKIAFGY